MSIQSFVLFDTTENAAYLTTLRGSNEKRRYSTNSFWTAETRDVVYHTEDDKVCKVCPGWACVYSM